MTTTGPFGLPPWQRPDPRQRVGDLERSAVADALGAHYAAGRLDPDDFDHRAGQALRAVSRRDLDVLLADLPPLPPVPPTPTAHPPVPWRGADVLAILIMISCLGLAAVLLLGLSVAGAAEYAVLGLVGGSVAAVGGAAGYHTLRRSWEVARERDRRQLRPDARPDRPSWPA
ncbi:hypothetical protein FHX74_002992 [Friedmanniella endophytica]|uniref:DUF1707 domain-containing protein n=1 Tax=Microlunatus kandeliicorticis TaxID=1759536 RepID=A0A7W3IU80_9ACTN|nr:DUF1707 domain-containing protein [Microlunatus kandeliicorticis]MBA8795356.1 hypothetical protein [Microlunatus kandeliicorticis]